MSTFSIPPKKSYIHRTQYTQFIHTIYLCALVFMRFLIVVLSGGLRTPVLGRGERRGSGIVPFERALVSSYRPSIVTFPLFLRVSDILLFLLSSTTLFPYPTSSGQNFPGSRWIAFSLYKQRRCWANCQCN